MATKRYVLGFYGNRIPISYSGEDGAWSCRFESAAKGYAKLVGRGETHELARKQLQQSINELKERCLNPFDHQ